MSPKTSLESANHVIILSPFLSVSGRMLVNILLTLFMREIPLKFSVFDTLPFLCIGYMIFLLQSDGKISVSYILSKSTFKNGKGSFNLTLIISMHIPTGPGYRFEWMDFTLAVIPSLVNRRSRSVLSLFWVIFCRTCSCLYNKLVFSKFLK